GEEGACERKGVDYVVREELHDQGLTVPEAMARGLIAAVHAHGEGHWTAPPPDEAVQRDLARAADKLTSGAAALRLRAEWLTKAASQLDAGAAELRRLSGGARGPTPRRGGRGGRPPAPTAGPRPPPP